MQKAVHESLIDRGSHREDPIAADLQQTGDQ